MTTTSADFPACTKIGTSSSEIFGMEPAQFNEITYSKSESCLKSSELKGILFFIIYSSIS